MLHEKNSVFIIISLVKIALDFFSVIEVGFLKFVTGNCFEKH